MLSFFKSSINQIFKVKITTSGLNGVKPFPYLKAQGGVQGDDIELKDSDTFQYMYRQLQCQLQVSVRRHFQKLDHHTRG